MIVEQSVGQLKIGLNLYDTQKNYSRNGDKSMICPKCNSVIAERVYTKESDMYKKGTKKYRGHTLRKYYKKYIYECMKCGYKDYRYDYVDVP